MFFDQSAKERIEKEKPLFDYARMYLTTAAFIAISSVTWKIWSLTNKEIPFNVPFQNFPIEVPKFAEYALLYASFAVSLFTIFLTVRIVKTSLDLSVISDDHRSNIRLAIYFLFYAFTVPPLPLALLATFISIVRDIK